MILARGILLISCSSLFCGVFWCRFLSACITFTESAVACEICNKLKTIRIWSLLKLRVLVLANLQGSVNRMLLDSPLICVTISATIRQENRAL